MPISSMPVKFSFGLQSKYDALPVKGLNTLYVLTDTQRLFVGETEITRPIQYGSSLPEEYSPPNSIFVQNSDTGTNMYFSKDGSSWNLIAQVKAETFTPGTFGENSSENAEGTLKIPQIQVDSRGNITGIQDNVVSIPSPISVRSVTNPALTGTTECSWEVNPGLNKPITGIQIKEISTNEIVLCDIIMASDDTSFTIKIAGNSVPEGTYKVSFIC